MNTPITTTDRLLLRKFETGDGIHFFQMNADPEVIKYTGDTPFKNIKAADTFIDTYNAYATTGIGRWAVIRRSDNAFLGWCGLKYHSNDRVVDIGFRLYRCYWNQGYATESAKAVIEYAFNTLKYTFLVAHAHRNNSASHAVIQKIGMHFLKDFDYEGIPAKGYRINNPDYTLKQITAKETWPVRHPVLRKGRPLEDVYMEADEQPSTFHIGMYYQNTIIGVASFMEDKKDSFTGKQHRLRGMAVLPEFRKKGIAELLLKKGENLLKMKECTLLWFNARIIAVSFYKKLGYTTVGPEFNIPLVGPHFLMKKELT